jgi:hypothetical protein
MAFCTADALGRGAASELRILTGLLKLRACRDNVRVATGAMELRGGNGYIEDWVNPRLVRDAHVGLLWEGTSNINALDVITRAVGKSAGHRSLQALLHRRLAESSKLPEAFRARLAHALDRAVTLAEHVAVSGAEHLARRAATALYDAASAALMVWEGAQPGSDASRTLLARCVLEHRLSPNDPLAAADSNWELPVTDAILNRHALTLPQAVPLLL